MAKVTRPEATEQRKEDHIQINLNEDVQFPRVRTGLESLRFMHRALPELNLAEIDTQVTVFGKTLSTPLMISSMTGGTERAQQINRALAAAAQEARIAMGVGSQRSALEDSSQGASYIVRPIAPDILLFANLGAVQLNYGFGIDECRRAVEMIGADALILHFNALQEAVQPEGDSNFRGLLARVEKVCRALEVPVIAKEVGWGFSPEDVRQLFEAGVSAIDVAGAGGTSWSEVEFHRAPTAQHANVARAFADWGIPTAQAIRYARENAPGLPIFASGGLRDGIDVAKCIALGADLGGLAGPFLHAANQSDEAVRTLIWELSTQLRIAMFAAGAGNIAALKATPLYPYP